MKKRVCALACLPFHAAASLSAGEWKPGARRNPFGEPECGHHYARSMASWAAILAMSDFRYSGVDRKMHFTSTPGTYFWSNGYAWGTCTVDTGGAGLTVLGGSLDIRSLSIGDISIRNRKPIGEGETVTFEIKR